MRMIHQTPKARSERLVVEELPEETLVYDLVTHDAHCLNPSAALVWKLADGKTTVSQMADSLGDLGLPTDVAVVWMALERLKKSDLLADPIDLPSDPPKFSRKAVLRILGKAAGLTLLLPAVDSVVAPLAAQTASCITQNACTALSGGTNPKGCTGLPVCNNKKKCCSAKFKKGKKGAPGTYSCKPSNC